MMCDVPRTSLTKVLLRSCSCLLLQCTALVLVACPTWVAWAAAWAAATPAAQAAAAPQWRRSTKQSSSSSLQQRWWCQQQQHQQQQYVSEQQLVRPHLSRLLGWRCMAHQTRSAAGVFVLLMAGPPSLSQCCGVLHAHHEVLWYCSLVWLLVLRAAWPQCLASASVLSNTGASCSTTLLAGGGVDIAVAYLE